MATATAERISMPSKMFYRINEVSRITGLKSYVLRYWESEFSQLKPDKDENDQRRYTKEDINLISEIKHLLYEERFTIAGAREKLKAKNKANIIKIKPNPAVRLKKIRKIKHSLESVRKDLSKILNSLNA